ncbi:aconitase A [Desulfitobacterium dichloroeliminans LMG P-21439]|uniref:Aconitase A n=1 Tax=Desulfitobacterium dichloroeliminans (strain LMG P-21439 / DCA1) TaxID=871963 RepID=L0F5H3_DESDL|nr:hydratase [Desulfitobacterium dichloroeliminans]AGA68432.1 aconitase A [Desulfitobacterium dichloroeliminans LMG P-21439]
MVRLINNGIFLIQGKQALEVKDTNVLCDLAGQPVQPDQLPQEVILDRQSAQQNTMAYQILSRHNTSGTMEHLKIRFDALTSHDITYVGIVQTARASGLKEFPIPYVLTNCHNSLSAVGGTINEDDHVFGLSAAQKYGGIFVPAHQAVIHQYMREMMTGGGKMLLGSDSHTRYGAFGTMGVGEGGPELVKQLLQKTYDIKYPGVVAIYLEGKPQPGVGPQDVALAIIRAVFNNGFVKNKVMEFVGPGIANLSVDFRSGIDVMTTETTCLSSIWVTDDQVKKYMEIHGRGEAYAKVEPGNVAYYDGMVHVDLSKIKPMIAMPFHPSNAFTIEELNQNPYDILKQVEEEGRKQLANPKINFNLTDRIKNGRLFVDQAIVAGCAGGSYQNIMDVATIVDSQSVGSDYLSFSVYPASQPIYYELIKRGAIGKLMQAGALIKTAFCGPCFGAGDVPANGQLSIRHTTRNFPNREGSKPGDLQISSVALMDARSIAATVINGGRLTPATEIEYTPADADYEFNADIYAKRVYQGFGQAKPETELKFGPNIADWPKMITLPENVLLKFAAVVHDPVTTTDELIPSGETSSYRSNPLRLAEFTLSRKEPLYVSRAKAVHALEKERQGIQSGQKDLSGITGELRATAEKMLQADPALGNVENALANTGIGTVIYAVKPGDGSAREQAASCQRVLGGMANIAQEYATKRYRSNLINWGMLPFTWDYDADITFQVDDYIFIPGIRQSILNEDEFITGQLVTAAGVKEMKLQLNPLTQDEREIILKGSLINYYAAN